MFSVIVHRSVWVDIYHFRASEGTANLSHFNFMVWEKHLLSNLGSSTITRTMVGALVRCLSSRSSLELSGLSFLIFKMDITM